MVGVGNARPWRALVAALVLVALVLVGCARIAITPEGDVVVTVLDQYGRPLPGVEVSLGGGAGVETTNAGGEATFEGIAKPYDMALYYAALNEVRIYLGMSLDIPVVRLGGASAGAWESQATLSGLVTNPLATANPTSVWTGFLTEGFETYGTMGAATASGFPYSATPHWSSSGSTTLYGYAIEAEYDGGGDVLGLRGAYETRSIDPGAAATFDLPLQDYTPGQIQGTVSVPLGFSHAYHEYGTRVGLDAAGFVDFPLDADPATGAAFDHVTMELPAPWVAQFYTYDFFTTGSGGGFTVARGSLGPNETGVSVSGTMSVPSLGLTDGDTLGVGDVIDLGSGGSTYALAFEATSPSATSPYVLVLGAGDQVTVPDLAEFGSGLGGSYSANLRRYSLSLSDLATDEMDNDALFQGFSATLDYEMWFSPTVSNLTLSY